MNEEARFATTVNEPCLIKCNQFENKIYANQQTRKGKIYHWGISEIFFTALLSGDGEWGGCVEFFSKNRRWRMFFSQECFAIPNLLVWSDFFSTSPSRDLEESEQVDCNCYIIAFLKENLIYKYKKTVKNADDTETTLQINCQTLIRMLDKLATLTSTWLIDLANSILASDSLGEKIPAFILFVQYKSPPKFEWLNFPLFETYAFFLYNSWTFSVKKRCKKNCEGERAASLEFLWLKNKGKYVHAHLYLQWAGRLQSPRVSQDSGRLGWMSSDERSWIPFGVLETRNG